MKSEKQSNHHGAKSLYENRFPCAYEPDEGLILSGTLQEIADTLEQVYEQAVPRMGNLKCSESDRVRLHSHVERRCTYKVSWVAD